MASFLNRLFGRKKEESLSFRRERAAELHGLAIRYVTERINGEDLVAGRGGCLSVRNGELILLSSEKIRLGVSGVGDGRSGRQLSSGAGCAEGEAYLFPGFLWGLPSLP